MSIPFRIGSINAAGGQALNPHSKEFKSVTQTSIFSRVNTAQTGGHAVFQIGSFNTPVRMSASLNLEVPTDMSASRHPSGHQDVIQDAYLVALVLSSHFSFTVRWNGTGSNLARFGMAYKFDNINSAASPTWVVGFATNEIILDMKQSGGWVWNEYSSQGFTDDPNFGTIEVDIPDVPELVIAMNEKTSATQFTTDDLLTVVADSAVGPAVNTFLHVILYGISATGLSLAWADDQIEMDVRCTQDVRLWRALTAAGFIEPGDNV